MEVTADTTLPDIQGRIWILNCPTGCSSWVQRGGGCWALTSGGDQRRGAMLGRWERRMLLSSQHGGLGVDLHFQDQEGACGRGMGMKTGLQWWEG